MGWRLARNVLDNMPAGLSKGERHLVEVIAWGVMDATGTGPIGSEKLRRRTDLTDGGITSALQRLAARGYELRVPLKWEDGKPVYAYRGRCRIYRIPDEWRPDYDDADPVDNSGERVASEPTIPEKGWPASQERVASQPGKGGQPATPRVIRGRKSQSRAVGAVEYLCTEYDVPEDDGLVIWQEMETTAPGPIEWPLRYAQSCVSDNREKWHPDAIASRRESRPVSRVTTAPTFPDIADLAENHEVVDSSLFSTWRKASPAQKAEAEAKARAELGDQADANSVTNRAMKIHGGVPCPA